MKNSIVRDVHKEKASWKSFLKDVFICSLGAYGGPEAHYGVFTDQLVVKKKYLSEEELVELIALTGVLPGPSSTQTIVAIGYKLGGPLLGLFTMLVWALPVLLVMSALSFLSQFLERMHLSREGLRYIGPMAVAFIAVAAYRLGKKIITDRLSFLLFLFGGVTTYFFHGPLIYPLVLLSGGLVSILFSKEEGLWNKVKLNPPWIYAGIFLAFALGSLLFVSLFDHILLRIFERFYRYGYLVIGGGQVVVPMMYSELVELSQWMSGQEFLTGYGLVQGLPGPMFSFSAYAGGLAAREGGVFQQILGALAGGIGIFLPGLLLIYFVYPIWENLKKIKGIKVSLKGITAVAAGLIATSALLLLQKNGFAWDHLLVLFASALLLLSKKVPAPVLVVLALLTGFLL